MKQITIGNKELSINPSPQHAFKDHQRTLFKAK